MLARVAVKMMWPSLFSLVFMGVGGRDLPRATAEPRTPWVPTPGSPPDRAQLKARQGPVRVVMRSPSPCSGMDCSVLVNEAIQSYRGGHGDACLTVFMIPSSRSGWTSVGWSCPRTVRRVQVTLKRSPLQPGERRREMAFHRLPDRITPDYSP
jgi:hypothetical protein